MFSRRMEFNVHPRSTIKCHNATWCVLYKISPRLHTPICTCGSFDAGSFREFFTHIKYILLHRMFKLQKRFTRAYTFTYSDTYHTRIYIATTACIVSHQKCLYSICGWYETADLKKKQRMKEMKPSYCKMTIYKLLQDDRDKHRPDRTLPAFTTNLVCN